MNTSDCDNFIAKAKVELANGNKELAIQAFKQALKLDAGCEEAIVNLVSYHGSRNELDICENLLNAATLVSPHIPRYHYMLGKLLLQTGYHYKSIQHLEEALKIEPNNAQIKIALAETHGRHGNFDAALNVLQPLLENDQPLFEAVVLFANISIVLNMNEDCNTLLARLSSTALTPKQASQLEATKQMLLKSRV